MKKLILSILIVALPMMAGSLARADIIFTQGNHPQSDEENILFGAAQSGTSITGATQSGISVDFSTLTGQTLFQTAQGQADIYSSANKQNSALTSLDITAPGYAFGDFIMNPQNGTGTLTVTVFDQFNTSHPFSYLLGPGQNFLTITTANGQLITDVQLTFAASGSFEEFKQPRVSSPCELGPNGCTPVVVPEPSSLALLGTALAGLGLLVRFRRRRPNV